jgi:hypothetical protein
VKAKIATLKARNKELEKGLPVSKPDRPKQPGHWAGVGARATAGPPMVPSFDAALKVMGKAYQQKHATAIDIIRPYHP